jgi:type II restriction/modification system DNA methylase subunit YeeA
MVALAESIKIFIDYVRTLKGDEKSEAQVFCDRLFQAFGYEGYKEAGAELEFRVKAKGKTTKYADLLWQPKLLLEMKKRGEKLEKHYQQVFEYWLELVPHRPNYVILCNFDEFWIYDFNIQLREPVDKLKLEDLLERFTVLNFFLPGDRKPQFQNNLVDVTRKAADNVAQVFNSLVKRGEKTEIAQRFILQCVVALFAEDIDLLPRGLFTELLEECQNKGSSYDLIGGLFRQMGRDRPAPVDSRYREVPYFNGGIFSTVEPISLEKDEINLLLAAAAERWSKVEPAIFGTLFESSMGKEERHALGAHFTSEADIQKVILPTIIRPWREKIEEAKTLKDLLGLRQELIDFKVLDPACGSGNFLYIAYREIKKLEAELLNKIHDNFSGRATAGIGTMSLVKTTQFYGIDIKPFAVELAKVTLMLAKKLALDEENQLLQTAQMNLPIEFDRALPLDNLDENIRCEDALFCEWESVNAIVGNPPFLGGSRLRLTLSDDYVDRIFAKFSDVKGQVDLCSYWFRLAHNYLQENCRAGLVATNSISQGKSRKVSLDYITQNGGKIYDTISTQPWSGEANVHISIINWLKSSGNQSLTYRIDHKIGNRSEEV